MKLTRQIIDTLKLPEGKSDHTYWDEEIPGFGLRIRESGTRKFVFWYRIGSQQRRMSLGPASLQTVTAARANAGRIAAQKALGEDPARAKVVAKQEAAYAFGAATDAFIAEHEKQWSPRYAVEVERYLNVYAKPLHSLPLTKIAQRDIANLLNGIARDRGDVSANRTRASLSKFFSWVLSEGTRLPEGNPVSFTRKRDEQSRDRVLKNDELRAIWNACRDDDFGAVVKLLILTGQRREEIAALRYDEINGDVIQYPKARTKNGVPHFVPLSDAALSILAGFPDNGREFLFGLGDTGFKGWVRAKQTLDGRSGVKDWTLHDLRRTCATRMAELGVQPHVIEAVLNHVSGHKAGVAGVYNRAHYAKERREALNLWAEHVMALVEGRKATVVPMKRA